MFTPDSKRTAYVAKRGNKWLAVVDGKEEKQYDNIGYLTFSPDSSHLAYGATYASGWFKKEKQLIVVDGKEEEHYDKVYTPAFSPDSRHLAYVATTGYEGLRHLGPPFAILTDKWFVVVDGKEVIQYDRSVRRPEYGGEIVFDSSDKLHYFTAGRDKVYMVNLPVEQFLTGNSSPQ